jgi:hypothetical protein
MEPGQISRYGDSRGSILGKGKRFFFSSQRPDWRWDSPNLLSNGYRGFFPRGGSGKTIRSSETSVNKISTRRRIPEDGILQEWRKLQNEEFHIRMYFP